MSLTGSQVINRLSRATPIFALVVFGFLVTLLATRTFHFTGFMGPDAGPRFAMMRSWHEHDRLVFLEPSEHGEAVAPNDALIAYEVRLARGTCTLYPFLFPFISAIPYYALGRTGLLFWPIFGALTTIVLSFACARALELRAPGWLALALAAASPLALYASTFWDHALQMGVAACALFLVVRAEQTRRSGLALAAGLVLGAGALIHETLALLGVSLALGALIRRSRWARAYGAGLVAGLASWAALNALVYGSLRGPHLMGPLDLTRASKLAEIADPRHLAQRATLELAGGSSLAAWAFVAATLGVVVLGLTRRSRGALALAITTSALALFLLLQERFALGLFQATPWLLVSLADLRGIDARAHADAPLRHVLATTLALFLALTLLTPVVPGLNWGDRYALTALPIMGVLALWTWEASSPRLPELAAYAGLVPVVVAAISLERGAEAFGWKVSCDRAHSAAVEEAGARVVATDQWWLASEMQPLGPKFSFYLTTFLPGSLQLTPPLPPNADAAVRASFFDTLDRAGETHFTFIGASEGLVSLRADAEQHGFRVTRVARVRDLVVADLTVTPPVGVEP